MQGLLKEAVINLRQVLGCRPTDARTGPDDPSSMPLCRTSINRGVRRGQLSSHQPSSFLHSFQAPPVVPFAARGLRLPDSSLGVILRPLCRPCTRPQVRAASRHKSGMRLWQVCCPAVPATFSMSVLISCRNIQDTGETLCFQVVGGFQDLSAGCKHGLQIACSANIKGLPMTCSQ